MFEKFNDTARIALLAAKDIADHVHQDHIGTEHLLLAVTGGYGPATRQWKNAPGISPKTEAVIAALGIAPETIAAQAVAELTYGTSYDTGRLPFSENLKQVLEYALRSSMILGDNHVGPEHLLAGLARNSSGAAGAALSRLGITDLMIQAAIQDSTPAPSPTAARSCDVYVPVGKSIFKNGAKIYPDLAAAQTAHPDQEIAPFTIQLADGEFFDVCTMYPKPSSWGKFASYPDAFAAAAELGNVPGASIQVRIMTPHATEHRGKDSRGHDIILGRSVEYTTERLMTRVLGTQERTAAKKEGARV
ncbi:Clp domain protein (plasmid) [Pseudarthrobacter chlorophenolicus A6]|uniref:Clp domain protein n=1 Tax=Pseudarthrobacter chlorophenolicus (strain ATCC 700700 / DSM 12829 / CIP 107037 / JCM 12360 / KCTC 9906 / NCIMB 13794 / A6) TaxID=452863 RepID=B8HIE5_PSECP|nr:Clp protease N-terminal domain-containing protein [Pseudarthrobacter chlorophenolicus]ACL42192.1 Clp domain protein [Pseudarthrobacter chlorophenolicus A6]SDQ14647.1 ATP-dependent Clp protease ATP-binding subunit ClpC [Pseudarthrobacter chlorophenolicus]